jgi:hypothetical protein
MDSRPTPDFADLIARWHSIMQTPGALAVRTFRRGLLAVLLLCTGCDGSDADRSRPPIDSSREPEAVESMAGAYQSGSMGDTPGCNDCTIRRRLVTSIGSSDGAAALPGIPRRIRVDGAGRYWLLYGDGPLVFDNTGKLLRSLVRRGQGPGEFREALQMAVLPGDSVLVWDAASAHVRSLVRITT